MRRMILAAITVFLLASPAVALSGAENKTSDYFSTKEGQVREYVNSKLAKGQTTSFKTTSTILPSRDIFGKTAIPVLNLSEEKDLHDEMQRILYFFVQDEEGFYMLGQQWRHDNEPMLLNDMGNPFYSLREPIEAGESWDVESKARKSSVKIESVDENITVPAGTFEECLKVSYTTHVYRDNELYCKNVSTTWYAPDIGEVKAINSFTTYHQGEGQVTQTTSELKRIYEADTTKLLEKMESKRRKSTCMINMKQLGLVLNLFAAENKDNYPRIDDVKGNLIFEGGLYPEYLADAGPLGCPDDPGYVENMTFRMKSNAEHPQSSIGSVHPDCITSESYVYLGWLVTNEKEGLAAIDAYFNTPTARLGEDLNVPRGMGNRGGSVIHRLTTRADRLLVTKADIARAYKAKDVNAAFAALPKLGTIPVMWEWPSNHGDGGHVLYLDGHAEFVPYPGKFPMTKKFIGALRKIEPQLSDDCLPIATK